MLKLKSNRGAAKRFRSTGKGKIKHAKAFARHLLSGKSPKRKRNLRRSTLLSPRDTRSVRRLLPYL